MSKPLDNSRGCPDLPAAGSKLAKWLRLVRLTPVFRFCLFFVDAWNDTKKHKKNILPTSTEISKILHKGAQGIDFV
jgi:hypothetical protein